MTTEKGKVSIHSENIFPIIKKWLYSDKDIFIRELVSNGCDAIAKHKRLASIGEASLRDDYRVIVRVDKENRTLTFNDNGIGMDLDEINKYINQVAFSGAEEFVNKYKDKIDESNDIIGHFGLGFYSAFMVADKVEIDTLSYKDGAQPVKWVSEDGMEFEISQGDRKEHGTSITLTISADNED
ncbi:MAG: ATP-binding protein, partial [Peptostreptococcus sp.]|nr:ATP-binding protein [Peptostreptococcus sp.]